MIQLVNSILKFIQMVYLMRNNGSLHNTKEEEVIKYVKFECKTILLNCLLLQIELLYRLSEKIALTNSIAGRSPSIISRYFISYFK